MAADKTRVGSFEEAFNRTVLTHGRVLVNQLAISIKVAQMHDIRNEAVEKAAEALVATLGLFFEDRKGFSLMLIGDYLFIEGMRVKYNVEDFVNFDFLAGEFKKRKLGSVSFNSTVDAREVITFVGIFLAAQTGSEEVYQEGARRLAASGVSGISTEELKAPKADQGFEKVTDVVKAATRAYVRVVLRAKELFDEIDRGRPADIRKLKRAVQSLVDSAYKGEQTLLRLTAIRRKEDLLPRHCANVCTLSLLIGKRLGLSKYQMERLGMAAMLHDIGRQGLPEDMFDPDFEMDEKDMELVWSHPRTGVETILRLKGLNEVAVSAMIVAYEHHRNLDGTGYPEALEPKEMSLFSKVVRIADNYDSSTSSGIYGRISIPPDKALALMSSRAGKYYDPELLAIFVSTMGVYPVGAFVQLTDGALGVVTAAGRGPDGLARPAVTLIGEGYAGEVVQLNQKDENSNFMRDVARTLDPQQARINIYKYLV
jgi:HD-GYP domain-containing protein (c-di-GMP phosphodiesterase class II)